MGHQPGANIGSSQQPGLLAERRKESHCPVRDEPWH
jgi:hypothetical protein